LTAKQRNKENVQGNPSTALRMNKFMKAFEPRLVKIPDRKVITIATFGDPNSLDPKFFKSLYGAAYNAKMKVYKPRGVKMELGKLCALWPDAHKKPKNEWTGIWAVPVPDYVKEQDLGEKSQDVKLEIWPGGQYAEILHIGSYAKEEPTIKTLHDFIEKQGVRMKEVPGTHEEEYLTKPDSRVVKTIIRYLIKK
jgi:hypothetical protein